MPRVRGGSGWITLALMLLTVQSNSDTSMPRDMITKTPPPMTTGLRVKLARVRMGISQAELAEEIGCTPAFVSLIESDHRVPRMEMGRRIAEALGVSLDHLAAPPSQQEEAGCD